MTERFCVTNIQRIIYVGNDEYKEKVISFNNKRVLNELIYHFSGDTMVFFNGKQMHTMADTIRFLPQGEVFEYTVSKKELGDCIDICFETDVSVSDEAFVLKVQQSEKLKSLFKKAFSVWVAKDEGYYFECISILYKILAELQKTKYIPEGQFNAIKPAIEYIEKHFLDGKINADELCKRCTVSYPYIKKLFVKKFGVPPIKYSIQLKINYACDLLKSGLYSVSQVAEICKYKDVYFFSRQFKEYMGLTPTEFINKYQSSK